MKIFRGTKSQADSFLAKHGNKISVKSMTYENGQVVIKYIEK